MTRRMTTGDWIVRLVQHVAWRQSAATRAGTQAATKQAMTPYRLELKDGKATYEWLTGLKARLPPGHPFAKRQ